MGYIKGFPDFRAEGLGLWGLGLRAFRVEGLVIPGLRVYRVEGVLEFQSSLLQQPSQKSSNFSG